MFWYLYVISIQKNSFAQYGLRCPIFGGLGFIKKNNINENKVVIAYESMVHHCNNNIGNKIPISQYDKAILFLHNIRLIRLEGGRVLHHMQIELYLDVNLNSRKQYTKEDYKQRMAPLYQRKRASIHIMNHYVELLSHDPMLANLFSSDYFTLGSDDFIDKYKINF